MRTLAYPFTEEDVRSLKAGDEVAVSGLVYTGRDRLHKYLAEGNPLPVDLHCGAVFHCGPVMVRDVSCKSGWRVVAAGPTTSMREEPYMSEVIKSHGVRVVIGKGGLGKRTLDACGEFGCVYLQAVGGAAALIAKCIRSVEGCHFLEEFGATEAMWSLVVDGLPAVVSMDTHGVSVYEDVRRLSESRLRVLAMGQ